MGGIMEGKGLGKRINMSEERPGIHGGQALGGCAISTQLISGRLKAG